MAKAAPDNKPVPTPASKPVDDKDYSSFVGSSLAHSVGGDWLLHSPPGKGKTFFAASGSEFYPSSEEIRERRLANARWVANGCVGNPPRHKRVVLEDMVWISAEKAPLAGLTELGIVVPYVIDYHRFVLENKPIKALLGMEDLLDKVLPSKLGFIVVDTASEIGKGLYDATLKKHKAMTRFNGFDMQGEYQGYVRKLREVVAEAGIARGGRMATLAHSRGRPAPELMDDSSPTAALMRETAEVTREARGGADIMPDFVGQNGAIFKGFGSHEAVPMIVDKKPGKPDEEKVNPTLCEYVIHFVLDGFETKTRMRSIFRGVEPAHMRELEDRVRKINAAVAEDT